MLSIRSTLLLPPVVLHLAALGLGRALPESHLAARTSDTPDLIPTLYNSTSNSSDLVPRASNSYCGVDYIWWAAEDFFYIYGNFPMDKNGGKLQPAVVNCGGSDSFHFENIFDDPRGFTWSFSGWVMGGQRNCVGNALISAGGNDKGGCWGSG